MFGFIGSVLLLVVYLFSPFLRLGKEILFGPVNIFSVAFQKPQELKNDNGRINILLLGVGGAEHDGPNLTDTIIVASANIATSSPAISLVSVPRDIYLDSLGEKVNAAYAIGLSKGPDVGLILAKATVSEITGMPIHYAARIDFSVFERIIDLVGGIDVVVQTSFDDPEYPIDGKENDTCQGDPQFKCRFEKIHFEAGSTHMDGKTALKFVRSRHAQGDEGTDFARSARQQLVIKAVKEKIFLTNLLFDPNKTLEIYNQLKAHVDTDFDSKDGAKLVNLAVNFRQAKFKNIILDLNLLENPPVDDRGWILLPKEGSWDAVHKSIKSQLE